MKTSLLIFILSTASLYYVDGCGTANVQCITETTYQFCFTVATEVVLVDGVQTCAAGTVCNENGAVVCEAGTTGATTTTESTTTSTTTSSTTPATGAPETCTTAGKYPADTCDQYWECLAVMWWYELLLQTCATGTSYDSATQTCIANGTCAGTDTTTQSTTADTITSTPVTTEITTIADTTTVASATGPPETCTEAGKYPAEACNQYWECLSVMYWYELLLQTCDANQQFNNASQSCVASTTCAV